jgi:hypothetical protein
MPALRPRICFIPLIAVAILIIENRASYGDGPHAGGPAEGCFFSEFPGQISPGSSAATVAGFDERLDEVSSQGPARHLDGDPLYAGGSCLNASKGTARHRLA